MFDPVDPNCTTASCAGSIGSRLSLSTGAGLDFALTLFGQDSVVGRSIVVSSDAGTGCSVLTTATLKVVRVAQVAGGTITLTQDSSSQFFDTTILVENVTVFRSDWDVQGSCESSVPFNPFAACGNVCPAWLSPCSPASPETCAVGSLGSKHGLLTAARQLYTDTSLPLFGRGDVSTGLLRVRDLSGANSTAVCTSLVSGNAAEARVSVTLNGVTGTVILRQDHADGPCTVQSTVGAGAAWMVVRAWPALFDQSDVASACGAALGPVWNVWNSSICQVRFFVLMSLSWRFVSFVHFLY